MRSTSRRFVTLCLAAASLGAPTQAVAAGAQVDVPAPPTPSAVRYLGPHAGIAGAATWLSAVVEDDAGAPMPSAYVEFTMRDEAATVVGVTSAQTAPDGTAARARIDLPPLVGAYELTASYPGNALHAPSAVAITFTLDPRMATSVGLMSAAAGRAGETEYLSAVVEEGGSAVSRQLIDFALAEPDGTIVSAATGISSRPVEVLMPDLPGTYVLTLRYDGSRLYLPSVTTMDFIVRAPPAARLAVYGTFVTRPNLGAWFEVSLTDAYGSGVWSQPVDLTMRDGDGVVVRADGVMTEYQGRGWAYIVAPEAPGSYTLTATFAGTPQVGPAETSVDYAVRVAPATVIEYLGPTDWASGTSVEVSARLTTAAGAPIAGEWVSFSFPYGTTPRLATTDHDGVARTTIFSGWSAGDQPLHVYHSETSAHGASSVIRLITVDPRTETTYTGPLSAARGSMMDLAARVLSGGYLVSGVSVEFALRTTAGDLVLVTQARTDGNGVATAPVRAPLQARTYVLEARTLGSTTYGPSVATTTFVVTRSMPLLTISPAVSTTRGGSAAFDVQVHDPVTSTALAGMPIRFALQPADAAPFEIVTDATGRAHWNAATRLAPGTYTVLASSAETDDLVSAVVVSSLEIRWEHIFVDQSFFGRVLLNPSTSEFAFEIGADVTPITSAQSMRFAGVDGLRTVTVTHHGDGVTMQGTFELSPSGRFLAVVEHGTAAVFRRT